ncbi:serine hydrolase domain-containing protein [Streptomyces sp. NPDC001985]|uniref:serine hydrolase domain-containing protein n=1 Tax=Streptomyces sp. NPDC001985 TaxID=3154406 RepID=UPI00331F1152
MTGRQRARTGVVALAAAAVAATALAAPARAHHPDRGEDRRTDHRATQRAFDALVAGGVPGVTGQVRDAGGVWKGAAGAGDRETGAPRGKNDRFRIGSITKTFVATVLLQLEAEGRLDLDDTVDRHLPGLLRGNGHDGRRVTVRQLLNHTSGVASYTDDPGFQRDRLLAPGFLGNRWSPMTPRQLVRIAMARPALFEPGDRHRYSNTNYIVAGMVLEKVTGNPYEREVRKRIIEPLGLTATSSPGNRTRLPQPSGRAYSKLSFDPGATRVHDVTELNASMAWASGDMISSAGDLNRFFSALMRGKVLPERQLEAMRTTVSGYGLGIETATLSCGTTVWGHGGGIVGSRSSALTTEDGRHAFAFQVNGDWGGGGADPVGAEFCGT